jgi:hypothetical protein
MAQGLLLIGVNKQCLGEITVARKSAIQNLKQVVRLCYQMLELAQKGDKCRQDDGCGIVFGSLRDNAYKIRRLAEKELKAHGAVYQHLKPLNVENGYLENTNNKTKER